MYATKVRQYVNVKNVNMTTIAVLVSGASHHGRALVTVLAFITLPLLVD